MVLGENSSKPIARISSDKEVQRQNVAIIRTGDGNRLSAPISLDTIRSQSLPLARSDYTTEQ